MPRTWTDQQRKEFGEKMAARRAAKQGQSITVTHTTPPEPVAGSMVFNPIANDVVAPTPRKRVVPKLTHKPDPHPTTTTFVATDLIEDLATIPLDTITYEDCGKLLNALSVASTSVAQARRQRQEQLEYGTHKAVCKTCGRTIDISKAGGFQILTERDEFHMPINKYYCSQNCLLARNMPSHARSTPRQKQVNQA